VKHTWKQKAKCDSCSGTGIYRGLSEKGRASVVCWACRGTGCREIEIKWEDFEGKIKDNDIKRVVEINPGIVINEDPKFGGMPYEDWFGGKPFPPKSENRNYICPLWWYQSADYRRKPDWEECTWGRSFSKCPKFKKKHLCWERWDKEFGGKDENGAGKC